MIYQHNELQTVWLPFNMAWVTSNLQTDPKSPCLIF